MPVPREPRISLTSTVVGFLVGTLLGLVTFTLSGLLWHAGATAAAASTSGYAVLLALFCLAATVVFGQPTRRRRARVPLNRALPHQWWPREADPVPMIAAVGGPLILGAGAALLLFR